MQNTFDSDEDLPIATLYVPPRVTNVNNKTSRYSKSCFKLPLLISIFLIFGIGGTVAAFIYTTAEPSPTQVPTFSPTSNPTENPTSTPTLSPTTSPTNTPTINPTLNPRDSFALFPIENRRDDDYVGIMFIESIPVEIGLPIILAARRWSEILEGNIGLYQPGIAEELNICNLFIEGPLFVDHLIIFVRLLPDDGPGGALVVAGPCGFLSNFAALGEMRIDIDDMQTISEALESVALHEIAHVLGIGTLWDAFDLLQNPVDPDNPSPFGPRPGYLGAIGNAEFERIGGVGSIDVEDGFTSGVPNDAGSDGVNVHFDEDAFGIELMTFRIKVDQPPLSSVTIQTIADLGYRVDVTKADVFSLNQPSVGATGRRVKHLHKEIVLKGDTRSLSEPISLESLV